MHAVGADKSVTSNLGSVRELQGHAVAYVTETGRAMIEMDGIGLDRAHAIDQHLQPIGR
jgi:hypothetical protein